ncbi:stabilizer of axonemal microtubules 1-like isoform X2 [Leptopilina heterotoma]|uniref:stabilizer of axonemal microtubules 1-like isoform X2 n=1 Tax=Leptopilina heterotoma TaxID=63436 RepID=UPI001CA7CA64|nr:stabilizer of axonemal microtubules 1-like isoform X2 [Leptopilina heterotoma]
MQICPAEPLKPERPPSIIEARNKIRLGHESGCNCCCCCSPEPKCLEYVQPEPAKSFAPVRYYWKPNTAMEDNTTYKLSFWDGPASRAVPYSPEDCLTIGDGPLSDETTHKLSYLGNWCVRPEPKITPCDKELFKRGPIQDVTTQKHDFTWKSTPKITSIKERNNLYSPCVSMSDDTTYKLSYYPSNCREPVQSFKPIEKYEKSDVPLDGCTTYKLSYWPNQVPVKEEQPWNLKRQYHPPVTPLDDCTTYKLSYWPNCEKPRKPFTMKNAKNLFNASCCFDDNTTYKLSFFGCGGDKADLIKQPENIIFSRCPLSLDTTNRLSYLGNWCVKPEAPVVPCRRDLLGKGPLQDVTTQKHDYTWKCNVPGFGFRPEDNLTFSPLPLECCTTNRLSYIPNNFKSLESNVSFKPIRAYQPCDVPFSAETTMRLSYQPLEPADKVDMPWSGKNSYQKPTTPLEENTTYNLSYIPPGKFVPRSPSSPPCPQQNSCENQNTPTCFPSPCCPCIACGSN